MSSNFMAASAVIWRLRKLSPSLFPLFPHLFAMKWWDQIPWSYFFWMLSFKPAFSPLSFTFIKRFFSCYISLMSTFPNLALVCFSRSDSNCWFLTCIQISQETVSENESQSLVCDSLHPHGPYSPWNSPGQNTGVASCSLLQEIIPTQRLSPGLLNCRQILYHLSHEGRPRILHWGDYPFSRGSSLSRNRTGISYIAGGFFTS